MHSYRPLIVWLFSGCLLIYLMVTIGGITRLTNSGLSMVEWKPTGSLPPMNEQDWQQEFDKYKQSPEYKKLNKHFTVADFKGIYWWEFIHRFLGRTIGLVFIVPFLWFLWKKRFPPGFIPKMLLLLVLGASQGILGWVMVKSGLVNKPHVSHYLLAAHLLTAFTTFGFTFWFALELVYKDTAASSFNKRSRYVSRFLLGLIMVQITFGAFVAGLKAGYVYPTFPKMGQHWIPPEITNLQPWWINLIETHAGVQFVHRILAYLVAATIIVLVILSRKSALTPAHKQIIYISAGVTGIQFLLGVLTILFTVPLILAILHQTGAFVLFAMILLINHRLK